MKAKISRGDGFRGVLNYIFKEPSHKYKGVVGGNMLGDTATLLVKEFKETLLIRPDIKNPVWHCSLSLPEGEYLDDQTWRSLTDSFMQQMGFSDLHLYTVVRHGDTPYDHVHIVASRISMVGDIWHGKRDVLKAITVTQQLERAFGLAITTGYYEKDQKQLSENEIDMAVRTKQQPPRFVLQQLINQVLQAPKSLPEFARELEMCGVILRANIASTNTISGLSFEYQGIVFKGSQLGKGYTWKRLTEKGVTYQPEIDGPVIRASYSFAARPIEAATQTYQSLQSKLDGILTAPMSLETFAQALEEQGIQVRMNLSDQGQLRELVLTHDGITHRMSKLGKAYTQEALMAKGVTFEGADVTQLEERYGYQKSLINLQQQLEDCMQQCSSMVALGHRLAEQNIRMRVSLAGDDRVRGVSFESDGLCVKGSDIGKSFTWRGLQLKGLTYTDEDRAELLQHFSYLHHPLGADAYVYEKEYVPHQHATPASTLPELLHDLGYHLLDVVKSDEPPSRLRHRVLKSEMNPALLKETIRKLRDRGIGVHYQRGRHFER